MTPEHLKALATLIDSAIQEIEAVKGPLPDVRHKLHEAQAMVETAMGYAAGTITPDGGGGKPP